MPLFGKDEVQPRSIASGFQSFAQIPVGDDAAARRDRFDSSFARRLNRLLHEDIKRCALKGRRNVRFIQRFFALLFGVAVIEHRRFKSAVRKIVTSVPFQHFRKRYGILSFTGEFLDMRPPRIREGENARDLIERFPRRVVQGTAEHLELRFRFRMNNGGVSAACKQRDKRRFERFVLQISRSEMPAYMIHADERNTEPVGKTLCEG